MIFAFMIETSEVFFRNTLTCIGKYSEYILLLLSSSKCVHWL